MEMIVATKNKGKMSEINDTLCEFDFVLKDLIDIGYEDEIDENGSTFEENALIKAREIHKKLGGYVLADDSGLMVDYLNGAPGIYTARYAGEHATSEQRNEKLLNALQGVPWEERGATFVCVIAVIKPDGTEMIARGECSGKIALEPKGTNGFGYDPIFYYDDLGMNIAELTLEQKGEISHRALALKKLKELFAELNG